MIQNTFLRKEKLDALRNKGFNPIQDLFDMQKMKTSGTAIIRSKRESKHKDNTLSFRSFQGYEMDDTGKTVLKTFGIPIAFNSDTSQFKFTLISIRNQKMFNLSNLQEAIEFHILKHHEWIEGSPNSKGEARFVIVDNEQDAINLRRKGLLVQKALTYVNALQNDELEPIAYLYGLNPVIMSENEIFAKLSLDASTKPGEIIRLFEQDKMDRKYTEAMEKALAFGLIKFDPIAGYIFRDNLNIGITKNEAMDYLRKNASVVQWLLSETESLIKQTKANQKVKEAQTAVAVKKMNESFAPNPENPVKMELISPKDLEEKMIDPLNPLQKTDAVFPIDDGPKIIGENDSDDDDLEFKM